MMGYFGRCGLGGFGMFLGPILFIGFLIGLVFLVVWAVRRMTANQPNPGTTYQTNPGSPIRPFNRQRILLKRGMQKVKSAAKSISKSSQIWIPEEGEI